MGIFDERECNSAPFDGVMNACWNMIGKSLFYSSVVEVGLAVCLAPVFQYAWNKYKNLEEEQNEARIQNGEKPVPTLDEKLRAFFGFEEYNNIALIYDVLQVLLSSLIVYFWIQKTYTPGDMDNFNPPEALFSIFFLFGLGREWLRDEFLASAMLKGETMIDVYTIVPMWMNSSGTAKHILTFGYLRCLKVLWTWDRISDSKLTILSEFHRGLISVVLRFVALVICFAGTMYTVEVVGEIDGFADQFVEVPMGFISFWQMCYFIFVTISTVGYGDFAPKTVLGRLFTAVFIVAGVLFFSLETSKLVGLRALEVAGGGAYSETSPLRRFLRAMKMEHLLRGKPKVHIVLTGGGLRSIPMVRSFFEELYHSEHPESTAVNVVILSEEPASDELAELLREPWLKTRVLFLLGSPTNVEDIHRAKLTIAEMAFVLADLTSTDVDSEDKENTVRAVALMKHRPDLPLRLMLVKVESRLHAVSCGVMPDSCFSVYNLKSNLLAQSCRCPGFSTFVLNLGMSIGVEYEDGLPKWLAEYQDGAANELYVFRPKADLIGLPFREVASRCYSQYGIVIIGTVNMLTRKVELNPQDAVHVSDQVIAVAHSESVIEPIINPNNTIPEEVVRKSASRASKGTAVAGWLRGSVSEAMRLLPTGTSSSFSEPLLNTDAGQNNGKYSVPALTPRGPTSAPPSTDGLILLALPSGDMWAQVIAFIRPLRASYLPSWPTISVLCPERPPETLVQTYPNVKFFEGSSRSLQHLLDAGLTHAQRVVVLAGVPTSRNSLLLDADGIMTSCTLDTFTTHKHRISGVINEEDEHTTDTQTHDVFSIVDMHNQSNVSVLPHDMCEDSVERGLEYDPRLVSGRVFTTTSIGKLTAMSYYNQDVLRIAEALTTPGKSKSGISWYLPVPAPFIGKTFGELYMHLLNQNVIAIAIQRAPGTGDSTFGYVYTCPARGTQLLSSDHMFVFGSTEWARASGLGGKLETPRQSETFELNMQDN